MDAADQLQHMLKEAKQLHKAGALAFTTARTYALRDTVVVAALTEAGAAPWAGLIDAAKLEETQRRLRLQAEALVDGGGLPAPGGTAGAAPTPPVVAPAPAVAPTPRAAPTSSTVPAARARMAARTKLGVVKPPVARGAAGTPSIFISGKFSGFQRTIATHAYNARTAVARRRTA
jgi:hypothetical protein